MFPELPRKLQGGGPDLVVLLGQYQGTVDGVPVILVEYAYYPKQVWAVSSYVGPSATGKADPVQIISEAVRQGTFVVTMLTVATDATWPPMEMVDESANIIGFDIDLMSAAAKAGGFQVQFTNTPWEGLFTGLDAGRYDAIISSITITDERKHRMDFSMPYINAGQVLVVRSETSGVEKIADLAGRSVGAQLGTAGAFEIDKVPDVTKKEYDEIELAFVELVNGGVDGVVCDNPTAANFALLNASYKGKLKIVGRPFTEEYYGIAVRKGNTKVLEIINKGLQKIIDSGEAKAIEAKWLK